MAVGDVVLKQKTIAAREVVITELDTTANGARTTQGLPGELHERYVSLYDFCQESGNSGSHINSMCISLLF